MLLATQLLAAMINYDLFDPREFVILFAWLPFLTIPSIYIQKRSFYIVIVLACFVESFIGLCHWVILKGPLTATALFVMSNTNYYEALEFMEFKHNGFMIFIVLYLILFVFALIKPPIYVSYPNKNFVVGIVFLFCAIFISENSLNERLIRKGTPQTVRALIAYFQEVKIFNAIKKRKAATIEAKKMHNNDEGQVFVLIIGESCNRNHMSIYNYKRKTNPKLEKRNDIFTYKNVVSGFSNTLYSVSSIISESNLENKMTIDKCISLIDVFHSAGFKTYWISNQCPIGVWDNLISNLAQSSDVVKYVNISSNSSFESTYVPSYDSKLFDPLNVVINQPSKNKFIVLHLMGNHSSYAKRYPKEYSFFETTSSDKEQAVNEYDNSVLYNDFIIDSLLNIISTYSKQQTHVICSAIYLSDHGEDVYDDALDYSGHDYTGSLPKSISEIPFIVWLSPNFKNTKRQLLPVVEMNVNKPFISDDLFHSVLDLNEIECKYFEKKRSIFNVEFNAKRVRVLEDNLDYDLKP